MSIVTAQETSLTVGVPVEDSITGEGTEHFYRVTPGAGQHLIVLLQKPSGFASRLDIKFKALPSDTLTDDTDGGAHDGSDQAVEIGVTKVGDYFIRVRAECCDLGGSYTIAAYTSAALPVLPIGSPVSGDLPSRFAERYYRVTPNAGAHLIVLLEKSDDFASQLDLNFKSLPTSSDHDDSDGGDHDDSDQAVEIRTTKAGDYFVRVAATCCDAGGPYTITAEDLTTLPALNAGETIDGILPRRLAERYYHMPTGAGAHLIVSLGKPTPFTSRLEIRFGQVPTDTDGDASDGEDGDASDQSADIPTTKTGQYFVRVRGTCCDDGGAFTLGATLIGGAPTCVGDCTGGNDVTVNELLAMVNIALGNAPVTNCPPGDADADGVITINEILAAVRNALTGCP